MMRKAAKPAPPIVDVVPGLRQRCRADGSWRVWWEPNALQRAAGAVPVTLDADKPGHAVREARKLVAQWSTDAPVNHTPGRGRSVNDLIADFRHSLAWAKLRPVTQRNYDDYLKMIAVKWGPQPAVLFDRPTVATWYEAVHADLGPWRAAGVIRVFSILMTHAELRGWRPENSNPCLRVKITVPEGRSRAASWDEIDALLWAARTLRLRHMRIAILLGIFGAQRVTDIRLARPGDFARVQDPGRNRPVWVWFLKQSKRGRALPVPLIHDEVIPALRVQLLLAAKGPGTLIWNEATGKPFSKDGLFRQWAMVRQLAASRCGSVATLQERDLRRTFANMARAGGADHSDVADVLGNSAATNTGLQQTYMAPQLATALRAVGAIQRPAPVVALPPQKRKQG